MLPPVSPYGYPPGSGGPTYPPPPGGPPPAGGGSNRNPMIAIIAVLVVIALAVGGYFLFKGDDKKKSPLAGASTTPTPSLPGISTPGPFPSESSPLFTPGPTDTGSSGAASWEDFTTWAKLVGTDDGTVTITDVGKFDCELHDGGSTSVIDYVECTNDGTGGLIRMIVAQFRSASDVDSEIQEAIDDGGKHVQWTSEKIPYGDKVTTTDADEITIGTSFCSIPTYMVFIGTKDGAESGLTADELNEVWKTVPFPSAAFDTPCS